MRISAYNSQKIRVLSFVAIMMVLFIHAVFNEAKVFPISAYVQELCSFSGLGFIANPLFFSVSGYLFFVGVKHMKDCFPKIRKRFRTLLVPYLIWNVIFVFWYVLLDVLPGVSQFVNSDMTSRLFSRGPYNALYELFISPAGFHLWYVRDLIVYVILSPVIYLFIKHTKVYGLALLFIVGTTGLLYLSSEIKLWGTFFFVMGGYVALHSSLDDVQRKMPVTIAYICLAIYLINAVVRPMDILPLDTTFMLVELCGLIAVWRLYDVCVKDETNPIIQKIAVWGEYSFFIYLFHEPTFNIIKKLGMKMCGTSEFSLILLYLICPFVMAFVSIFVAKLMKLVVPKFYGVLVGGR